MAQDMAGKARTGDARTGNAARARGQASDKRIPTPTGGNLARKGGKIPLDGVNKKPLK